MLFAAPLCGAQTLYTFGEPTGDEQLYLELINRARANPPAEGARLAAATDPDVVGAYDYFNVDLAMMQGEFNAIPAAPPLVPNGILTGTARQHSGWMLANAVQDHYQNGVSPGTRMRNAGYNAAATGENINAYAESVFYGHASLAADWGYGGTGGMQPGRGHRAAMLGTSYREIGVGVVYGTNGAVGPQVLTQDFARLANNPTFGTGVAYYDLDEDGFYDSGEGIQGLTVNVSGSSYYCQTAPGGGWVVPIPNEASNRTVSFTGPGLDQTAPLANAASTNVKLDLKLVYKTPQITNSTIGYLGIPNPIAITPVPGAPSYVVKHWTAAAAANDNAENTNGVTSSVQGGYSILSTGVKAQGASSFKLVNSGGYSLQWIKMKPLYRGGSSPVIRYQRRRGTSGAGETFRFQIQEDGKETWTDLDTQAGGAAEGGFTLREIPIPGMAGKNFRLRIALQYAAGTSYWVTTADGYGWYVDALQFTNIQQLQNETSSQMEGTSGSFITTATGPLLRAVYPVISGRAFPPAFQNLEIVEGLPPGFDFWASTVEQSNSLPPGSLTSPLADYDNDGLNNLLEYAFGSSPLEADEVRPRLPVTSMTASHLVMDYKWDTSVTDLDYGAEASTDLLTWRAPGAPAAPAGFTDQLLSTNGTIQTRRAAIPRSAGAQVFIRMRVTK